MIDFKNILLNLKEAEALLRIEEERIGYNSYSIQLNHVTTGVRTAMWRLEQYMKDTDGKDTRAR